MYKEVVVNTLKELNDKYTKVYEIHWDLSKNMTDTVRRKNTGTESSTSTTKNIYELMDALGLNKNDRMRIYDVYNTKLNEEKRFAINNWPAYLSTVIFGVSNAFQTEQSKENVLNIIKCLENKIDPLEYMEHVFNRKFIENNSFQCGVLPWMIEAYYNKHRKRIYVANPSPAFTQMMVNNFSQIPITFITEYNEWNTYLASNSNSIYSDFEDLKNLTGKHVFYMAQGIDNKKVKAHIKCLMANKCSITGIFPDKYKDDLYSWVYEENQCISQISLLPETIFKAAPKRQFIATIVEKSRISLIGILKYTKVSCNGASYLCGDETSYIEAECLKYRTLRVIWQERLGQREYKNRRSRPEEYRYSREISYWYTISKYTDAIYADFTVKLFEYPTGKELKRKWNARGKEVPNTRVRKNNLSLFEIDNFINEDSSLRKSVRKATKAQVLNRYYEREMSLRTLWYCYFDEIQLGKEGAKKLKEIVMSDKGDLYISEIQIYDPKQQWKDVDLTTLKALNELIKYAIKKKHYEKSNPLHDLIREKENRSKDEEAINKIKSKNFTQREEKNIVDKLLDSMPNDISLALLIELFTGLKPEIIAQLCWEDFKQIGDFNAYQLIITKETDKDGNLSWLDAEPNQCRRIPLMSVLSEMLVEQKERKQNPDIPEQEFEKARIICENSSPKNVVDSIKSKKKQLILGLGRTENTISMPTESGIKTANLNTDYRGDMFRNNFENRCFTICGMSEAELNHLLGRTQTVTFYKHYLDFNNTLVQKKMSAKLDQWGRFYEPKKEEYLKTETKEDGKLTVKLDHRPQKGEVLQIEITAAKAEINFETLHGNVYTVNELMEDSEVHDA